MKARVFLLKVKTVKARVFLLNVKTHRGEPFNAKTDDLAEVGSSLSG
jgi:hypothetical protein